MSMRLEAAKQRLEDSGYSPVFVPADGFLYEERLLVDSEDGTGWYVEDATGDLCHGYYNVCLDASDAKLIALIYGE